MFLWLLFASFGIWLFYQKCIKPQNYWRRNNVKQLFGFPIFGDNWRMVFRIENLGDFLRKVHRNFPNERYYGVYQTNRPTLVLRDPDLIKQIGVKDFDHFLDHMNFTSTLKDEIWTRNLFALRGQKWREMRATLSPTFTSSKMKAMFTLMKQSGEQYVNFYQKQEKELIELEAKDSFTRFTNDVIANCAFGIGCDSLNGPNNVFYLNGKKVSNLFNGFFAILKLMTMIYFPPLANALGLTLVSPNLGNYFKTIVRDSLNHREEHNIVRPDMINLLMEAKKGLLKYEENANSSKSTGFATVEESHVGQMETKKLTELSEADMAAQVFIFLIAGFDTVSTMMTFMSYALATNPDIQEKLRNEIDDAFEATQGNLTYDILAGMKYMDMVVSESLRMYPPGYAIDRECNKPYVIEPKREGETPIHLKEGDLIWINIIGLHFDPEHFPEPNKFIPERFSEENKSNIKPYTYLPFGVGPRNCIGSRFALMEIKILFYNLLLNYEIVPVKRTTIPLKLAKGTFNPTFEGGCWVGFKQRETIKNKRV